jgi:hypothetical protein
MSLVELLARCSLQYRAPPNPVVVGWQLYDWAESATLIAYNLFSECIWRLLLPL